MPEIKNNWYSRNHKCHFRNPIYIEGHFFSVTKCLKKTKNGGHNEDYV